MIAVVLLDHLNNAQRGHGVLDFDTIQVSIYHLMEILMMIIENKHFQILQFLIIFPYFFNSSFSQSM